MSTLCIVDIDDCITDGTRRAERAGPEPDRYLNPGGYEEWRNIINEGLEDDAPIVAMRNLVTAVAAAPATRLVYLTARGEELQQITRLWLIYHRFPPGMLEMRTENDWRKSADYKAGTIEKLKREFKDTDSVLVIDDDKRDELRPICAQRGWMFLKAYIPEGK